MITSTGINVDERKLIINLLNPTSEQSVAAAAAARTIRLAVKLQLYGRGTKAQILVPEDSSREPTPVPSLVDAVARARDWYEKLTAGKIASVDQLIRETHLSRTYILRILRCAVLCPRVVEAVLSGRHPTNVTLPRLTNGMLLTWRQQESTFFE